MNSNGLQILSFIILGVLLAVSIIQYSVLKSKYRKVLLDLVQAQIDKNIYKDFYQKNLEKSKEELGFSVESQDDFIKFLSNSRDWAFKYIDDVQSGLKRFVDDIKPEIDYFNEYGDLTSMQPNYYSLKKISDAYKELKTLLPEEESK